MTRKLADLLGKSIDILKELESEIRFAANAAQQKKNDYESLIFQVQKKEEQLAAIDADLRSRAATYEQGLQALRDGLADKLREAEAAAAKAGRLLEEAAREKELASRIRAEAEAIRGQMVSVKSRVPAGK